MSGTSTRVPPHNLDAEVSLLGAMLMSLDAVHEAMAAVRAEDFHKPAHGHIFDAIVRLVARGEPADAVTVADELAREQLLDQVGGVGTLVELMANTASIGNAHRYADIVADLALQRRLIAVGGEIAEAGYEPTSDVAAVVDRAEQLLFALTDQRTTHAQTLPAAEIAPDWLNRLIEAHDTGRFAGVLTGFVDLDAIILGLVPGQLVVAAGRPGMGKTSFGLGVALNAARAGHPTLLASLEMSSDEVTARLVSAESKIMLEQIRAASVGMLDWPRITGAVDELGRLPLDIHDEASLTIATLRGAARRTAARYGRVDLIVVDYLQLMRPSQRHQNREGEVAEIARDLKRLARDVHAPVLALAQLSRGVEQRADKRPNLADLRESGEIENSADAVLMLYRDDYYKPDSPDRGTAEVIVAKQRNGPLGTAQLAWMDRWAKFSNMARV